MSFWKLLCCSSHDNHQSSTIEPKVRKAIKKNSKKQINPNKQDKPQIKQQQAKKDCYEGQKFSEVPNGHGTMIYANGDFYTGQWVMGTREGRGIQFYHQSGYKYEGEWKNNKPNGSGKIIFNNASFFQGTFYDGQKNGKGQYYDFEDKKTYLEIYDHGVLKDKKTLEINHSRSQDFPTLVLDKERFQSNDLLKFQQANPQIKQLKLDFLLKYYCLKRIIHLTFIDKDVSQWNFKQVLTFLNQIGLKQYQQIFYQNKIKGKDLASLKEKQMKQDLRMKLGDRKKLMHYINYLHHQKKKSSKTQSPSSLKLKSPTNLKINSSKNSRLQNINSLNLNNNLIIRQQSEQQGYQGQEYPNKRKVRTTKKSAVNFITQDWMKYASIADDQINSIHSMNYCLEMEQQANDKVNDIEDYQVDIQAEEAVKYMRKISEQQNTEFKKSIANKQSSSSESESDDEDLSIVKKKKSNSNIQMSKLFQFLKGHKIQDFIIKEKDIEIMEQIGEGGYGKVYKGKLFSSPVAIKDYLKAGRTHKSLQDFMKQVDVLSDLKHPNIVLYMGVCITVTKYRLVTEFMDNGSLFDQLHKKGKKFQRKQQFQMVSDIVKGMVYLHNMKNVLHRDLKSSNVLIAQDWKVKLCDFGLSVQRKKKSKKNNRIGTIQWMAPEVIRNEEIDFASDVYSFGVILWEILSQKIPYEGLAQAQIIGLVGYDPNHKLPKLEGDQFLVRIMEKCLNKIPGDRPTFKQIQDQINQIQQKVMAYGLNKY